MDTVFAISDLVAHIASYVDYLRMFMYTSKFIYRSCGGVIRDKIRKAPIIYDYEKKFKDILSVGARRYAYEHYIHTTSLGIEYEDFVTDLKIRLCLRGSLCSRSYGISGMLRDIQNDEMCPYCIYHIIQLDNISVLKIIRKDMIINALEYKKRYVPYKNICFDQYEMNRHCAYYLIKNNISNFRHSEIEVERYNDGEVSLRCKLGVSSLLLFAKKPMTTNRMECLKEVEEFGVKIIWDFDRLSLAFGADAHVPPH